MEKQTEGLIVNILMFSSRLIVLIIGGLYKDALFTIALYGTTGAVLWIFNCIYIQHLVGISYAKTLSTIGQQIVLGLPYVLLPILVHYVTKNSLAFVAAGICSGIIFCFVQGYRMK
jgi:hypothetical protein